MESSLANWDGSFTPPKTSSPIQPQNTGQNTIQSPTGDLLAHNSAASGSKKSANMGRDGGEGGNALRYGGPQGQGRGRGRAANVVTAPAAAVQNPPAPMLFGRPQDILTTPLPAARPAPLLPAAGSRSAHTPDIPMQIHTFGGAPGAALFLPPPNPNPSLLAPGHGAPTPLPRPPVPSPISTPTRSTFSSPFGPPGPALRGPPAPGLVATTMSTLSVPVLGSGVAAQHAAAGGNGKTRALAPRKPTQNLHAHPNPSSPLSSLSPASAGSSPGGAAPGAGTGAAPPPSPAAGSWWVSGGVYGGSGEQDTTTSANASTPTLTTARVQGYGYGYYGAGGEQDNDNDRDARHAGSSRGYGYGHAGENTGHMRNPNRSTTQAAAPALDVRHKDNEPKKKGKQVITYMSRAKKAGGSTSGKSTSSGSSKGGNKDEQEWEKPKVKLFLRSPKIPHSALPSFEAIPSTPHPAEDDADVRALFTPSPQPLFTSPPSPRPDVWRRGPPAPGMGAVRQAGREERKEKKERRSERMKYVLVPPAPYAIKRARREVRRTYGGRERGRSERERWGQSDRTDSGRSRSRSRGVQSWRSEDKSRWNGSRSRSSGRSAREDYESDVEWSRSRSRSKASQHLDGPSRRLYPVEKQRIKSTTKVTGGGAVHESLGDALNNAWANNEARGTMGTGEGVGRGKRKEREQGRQERNNDDEEWPRKRPRKYMAATTTTTSTTSTKRIRKAPRPPDDVSLASPVPAPAWRGGAWCKEDKEKADGVVELCFDITIAEADRAACAALLWSGIPGLAPATEASLEAVQVRSVSEVKTCILRPRSDHDDDVWAGAAVCGREQEESDEGEQRPRGAKRGRKPRLEAPQGQSTERTSQTGSTQGTTGEQPPNYHHLPPPPAQQAQELPASNSSSSSDPHELVGGQLYLDLSQPKPKLKPKKPRPLPALAPSDPAPVWSEVFTPTSPSALDFLPMSGSPATASAAHSHPHVASFGADVQVQQMELELELLEEGPMPIPLPLPQPLSAKAWGKQKMPDDSVDVHRTPSPVHMDAWIHSSTSRERRSVSRGRRSRSASAARGHLSAALVSPMQEMSQFYAGFDPSPPRIRSSGPKTTPQNLHYSPTMPSSIPTSYSTPDLRPPSPTFYPPLDDQPYGDGTVDPSMLGGKMEVYEPEPADFEEHLEEALMGSPRSASTASSSSSYEPAAPPSPLQPSPLRVSGRRHIERRIPDGMVATDLLGSENDSSASSSGHTNDRPPSPAPKPKAAPTLKPKGRIAKGGPSKVIGPVIPATHSADPFFRYSGPPWPPGDPDAFCHQCRRKTKRLSMKFDSCIHCYCVACIMMKYGGITIPFEAISSSENCPRCNDICSCDNCTSRRGEEYQFGRYQRPKDSPESELVLRAPRTSGAVRVQNNPYRMLDQMVIEPITHYATLYNLSGAPIGQTFLGADGNSEYVVAKPTQPRRVFVGAVPESWLLGPDPVVYQMPLKVRKQKKKQKLNRRLYVGDPSVLALRARPRAPPVPPSTSPIQSPLPIATPAAPSAPPAPVQAEMDVDLPDPLSVEAVPAASTTPPRVPLPDMDPVVPIATPAAPLTLPASVLSVEAVPAAPTTPPRVLSPDMDPVVPIATPAAPLTLPASVQAEMDVDLPDPVSVETGPAAPTTPPHVPSPDMDVDLPDPFGSPLTSVADSETAGEEDAEGASEKVGNEGAFPMPGDDDAEQLILDAHGEPEAAGLDSHATPEIACVQDIGHNHAQAQSGRGLPFNPADGSAGHKFSQTDGDDRCDTGLAGASPLTHPPITVAEIDTVDVISCIPTAELPQSL